MNVIHLDIDPVPAARPRIARNGGRFYPKKYTEWRSSVGKIIGGLTIEKVMYPLAVFVGIECERPRTTKLDHPKPDADNYAKAVLDCLNGVAWEDDSQIVWLVTAKRWADSGSIDVLTADIDGGGIEAVSEMSLQWWRHSGGQPQGVR